MTEAPNIVVALLDSARADRFSCYGHNRETSPFLDSLAEEGTRYDEAYSTSIWSFPAYTSLFTGELPSEHGIVSWDQTAKNRLTAELDSYHKMSVSPHIMNEKFGLAEGFDSNQMVSVPHKSLLFEPDPVIYEMRDHGLDVGKFLRSMARHRTPQSIPNAAHQFFKKAVRYRYGFWQDSGANNVINASKKAVSEANQEEPFFLFMNFVESHTPMYLPREWTYKYTDRSVEEINRLHEEYTFFIEESLKGKDVPEEDKQLFFDLHDASIAYLDHQLQRFYEHLETIGEAENTVFVILSDHGDLFGEHGIWGHHVKIHRNLCRVPLIIRYPFGDSEVVTDPVSIRAVCDNLIDISRGEQTKIEGEESEFIEYAGYDADVLEDNGVPTEPWRYYQVSCVSDGWRLNWRADDHTELYCMDEDPDEETDLSDSRHQKVEELQAEIETKLGHPTEIHQQLNGTTATDEMDSETLDHLKAMGYLGED